MSRAFEYDVFLSYSSRDEKIAFMLWLGTRLQNRIKFLEG